MKRYAVLSLMIMSLSLVKAQETSLQIERDNPIEKNILDTVYAFIPKNCDPCINQLINLAHLKKNVPGIQIKIVTLKSDKEFLDYIYPFNTGARVISDEDSRKIIAMGIDTLPTYIYVNKNNKILGVYEENLSKDDVVKFGDLLVKNKPLPNLAPKAVAGQKAPEFDELDFISHDKNWVVFHSSSCPFSAGQLPTLLKYAEENPEEKFYIVAFGDQAVIDQQFNNASKNITVLPTNGENNMDIAIKYDITGTPTQFLIDDRGSILSRDEGFEENKSVFQPK